MAYLDIYRPLKAHQNLQDLPCNKQLSSANNFERIQHFSEVLETSAGKEKIFKSVQYFMKLILVIKSTSPKRNNVNIWLSKFVVHISMFRNINEIGDWIQPGLELIESTKDNKTFDLKCIRLWTQFWNSIFDDIYCVLKMQASPTKEWADDIANRFWLINIWLGLYIERLCLIQQQHEYDKLMGSNSEKPYNEEAARKLKKKRILSLVNFLKLLCDMMFVCEYLVPIISFTFSCIPANFCFSPAIDVFHLRVHKLFQILPGLAAAFLGYKNCDLLVIDKLY